MAFIKLRDIPSSVRRDMVRKAGYREETNMLNARWISTTKDGDLIRFTRSNPNFRKNKYETTSSFRNRTLSALQKPSLVISCIS